MLDNTTSARRVNAHIDTPSKEPQTLNTARPKVSVVIPAYNQAQYLAETIDSVLAQTCQDFEVIVIDDESTDNTADIVKGYGDAVRYVWQGNQGLAGARNTGIQLAEGEYIALLDSDDAWQPTYLAQMLALAEREPEATVYYCGVCYIDQQGQPMSQGVNGSVIPPDQVYETLLRINPLVPSTILMRRAEVIAAGSFDVAFRRLQDWELWVRLLKAGHRFAGLADGLVRYRIHNTSLSTDPTGGQKAALAVATKHFGPDDGEYKQWCNEKRLIYGGVYRYCGITSSLLREQDWETCAHYLRLAFQLDPILTKDLDLFYELALGTQPLGQRGTSHQLALTDNLAQIDQMLEQIFKDLSESHLNLARRQADGTARYALGLVAYNLGQYDRCIQYLVRAIRFRPGLCFDTKLMTTLSKSVAGYVGLDKLRLLRRSFRDL